MDDTQNFYLMFGRLEGKVDTLLSQQGGINKRIDDHDTRITQLENQREQQVGILSSIRWGWVLVAAAIGTFSEEIKAWILR
ncbi:hypothetical protein FHW77_002968 [Agrobacterium sp. RC10-4-1]|uniref:hypothetical protein n=1 Tax=Agrobacterium sp. RC10-4-1 TaxID=2587039 RepID=UPI000DDD3E51|nr:hypothetical protein [Agrobacterium sp. RC10-4-1]MBA8799229.1 hypothetical protein [Agrobacterium sp. RC10-4-1]